MVHAVLKLNLRPLQMFIRDPQIFTYQQITLYFKVGLGVIDKLAVGDFNVSLGISDKSWGPQMKICIKSWVFQIKIWNWMLWVSNDNLGYTLKSSGSLIRSLGSLMYATLAERICISLRDFEMIFLNLFLMKFFSTCLYTCN